MREEVERLKGAVRKEVSVRPKNRVEGGRSGNEIEQDRLSPILFKIMLLDLPFTPQTTLPIYSDDLSITTIASSLQDAQPFLQRGIDNLR